MKLAKITLTALTAWSLVWAQATDLLISEYAEGSSNNKYIEIYNGTGASVDLSGYAYPNVSNAPTTAGEHEFWNEFESGATIADGDVYVICHGSSDAFILAECDETHGYLSNGDDGYALVSGTESSFTVIDVIGQNITDSDYADPGSGWDVAGTTEGTKDHTLVRKSSVTSGQTTWSTAAGTDADDSEWIVLANDTWDLLGSHNMNSSSTSTDTLNEGFEGGSIPSDWTATITSGSYNWALTSSTSSAGSYGVYYNSYSASGGSGAELMTKRLDLSSASSPTISFDWKHYSSYYDDSISVHGSADGGTTWSRLGGGYSQGGSSFNSESLSLSSLSGNNVYVKFIAYSGYGASLYLDNIGGPPIYVSSDPSIALESSSLDIGDVVVDSTGSAKIGISNSGAAALTVTSITSSSSEVTTDVSAMSIAAGASDTLSVSWTPSGMGRASSTIEITSDAANSPDTLTVTVTGGRYIEDFSSDALTASFAWSASDVDGGGATWSHSSSYDAMRTNGIYNSSNEDDLVTPTLSVVSGDSVIVSTTYSTTSSYYGPDSLIVRASTDDGTTWTGIDTFTNTSTATYAMDLESYAGSTVKLSFLNKNPDGSSSYYRYLYSAVLPALYVDTNPVASFDVSSLDLGTFYIGQSASDTITVSNTGAGDLTLDITASGSLALDSGSASTVTVSYLGSHKIGVSLAGATAGTVADSVSIVTNMGTTSDSTFVITVSGTVDALWDYTVEDFESYSSTSDITGAGWSTDMSYTSSYGNGSSKGLTRNIYGSSYTTATVTSGPVDAGDSPLFKYNYRVTEYSGHGSTGAPTSEFTVYGMVSTDWGATYDTVSTLDANSATATAEFTEVSPDVSSYANSTLVFKIITVKLSGDNYVDYDDITLGSQPATATLSASTDTLTFSGLAAGIETATSDVIISNSGGADATLGAITLSAPFSTGYAGGTVASGGADTISITYSPTSGGSDTADVALSITGSFTGDSSFVIMGSAYTLADSIDYGFEESLADAGWSTEAVVGSGTWSVGSSSSSANTGSGYGSFNSSSGNKANLLSPYLDLSSYTRDAKLSFYYKASAWGGDQDSMNVAVSVDTGATFTKISALQSDYSSYTEVLLTLGSSLRSAATQIRFQGIDGYGYGISLDDILLYEAPAIPDMALAATSYNFGPVMVSAEDTVLLPITNDGGADLNISAATGSNTDYTTDFTSAITIAAGAADTVALMFAPTATGTSVDTITFSSDDTSADSAIALSGWGYASDYEVESFASDPANNYWTSDYTHSSTSGYVYSSPASGAVNDLITPRLDLSGGDASYEVGFYWAQVDAYYTNADSAIVYYSDDLGVTWTSLGVLGGDAGTTGGSFNFVSYTVPASNDSVHIKWSHISPASYYYNASSFYVDDAYVPPVWVNLNAELVLSTTSVDFGLVEIDSTAHDTITITNNGAGTLTIDSVYFEVGYVTSDFTSISLAQDSSAQLALAVTPNAFNYPGATGDVMILSNDPNGPDTMTVTWRSGRYVDDFDSDALAAANAWTTDDIDGDGDTWEHYSSGGSMRTYGEYLGANEDNLVTPTLSVVTGDLAIYTTGYSSTSSSYGPDSLILQVSTDDGTTWVGLDTVAGYTETTSGADLSAYVGSEIKLSFLNKNPSGSSYQYRYLSEVALPAIYVSTEAVASLSSDSLGLGSMWVGQTATDSVVVTNTGGADLTLDITASGSLTLDTESQSQVTVASGGSHSVVVSLAGTAAASVSETVTIVTNTGASSDSTFTVPVTATVNDVGSYTVDDFEGYTSTTEVKAGGWNTNMSYTSTYGNGSSKGVYKNIWSSSSYDAYIEHDPIDVGDTPVLKFNYRVTEYSAHGTTGAPSDEFNILVLVSTDYGSSYTTLDTIGAANHTVSGDFAEWTSDISAYADQALVVRVESKWVSGDNYVDMDEFTIGTMPSTATLAMASDTLNLGSHAANIGSASSDQVVSNSGGADATVTAVTITGSSDFSTDYTSGTVPAAGSDTISITYTPTDGGSDTAVVTLSISGAFDGDSSFVVMGSGYAPIADLSEGFESGFPPDGWTNIMSGTDGWEGSSSYGEPHSGSAEAYSDGDGDSLITPYLDLGGDQRLRLWHVNESSSYDMGLEVSVETTSGWTVAWASGTLNNTDYQEAIIDLSSYGPDTTRILIATVNGEVTYYGMSIDDISIEDIPLTAVLDITSGSINAGALAIGESYSDTVTIGSNSGAVGLAISSVVSDDSSFVVSATDDTVAAGSDVDLAVSWTPDAAGSASASVVITSNAPSSPDTVTVSGWAYADDYDHHGFEQTGGLADGWSVSGTWYLSTSYYHSGSQAIYSSYSNTEASITTARLDASDGSHEVGFWHMNRGFGDGSADSTTFYVSTDGGATWVAAGGIEKGAASTWAFSSYDLGEIASDNVVFKWTYTGSGSYTTSDYFYLDDAYLPAAWVSPDPLLELQGTAATFDVVVAGTETDTLNNLEIYNNGAAILTIDSISYVGSGYSDDLSAAMSINPGDTGYVDIYFDPSAAGIYEDAAMFHSNSVGGDSAITLSGFAVADDYTHEGFEGGLPDSWSDDTGTGGSWTASTSAHSGSASYYSTYTNTDAKLITRRLDTNDDGNHYLAFWWAETSTGNPDSTIVSVSSDGGASWVQVDVVGGGSGGAWTFESYDLGVLRSDDVYIQWNYVGDGSFSAWQIYLDDVYIPPTYYPATAAFTLDSDTLDLLIGTIGATASDTSFDIGSSQGGIGLVIDSVMSSSADLSVSLASVAAGDTTASGDDVLVDITYSPSSFGRSSYTVTFYSNDPNSPQTVVFNGDAGRMVANFDDAAIPYGWTNVDNDGDGNMWSFDYSSYGPGESGNYARSKFSTSGADDWLITRKLSVVADDSIIFFHNSSSSSVTAETLKVFVSTTDNAITSFGSTPLTTVIPVYGVNGRSGADLSLYNGQDIYVAIVHNGAAGTNNYSYLRVDDVLLPEKFVSTDPVLVVDADTLDFGLGLLSDTDGSDVSLPIRNEGAADLTYTVTSDNAAFTVTPVSGTVDSLGFDTLTITFTASDTGMYAGNVVITHDGDSSPDTVYVMGEGVNAALAEGFETGAPDWLVYQLGDANDAWELTTSSNSGDYAIWHDDNNVATGANDWIVSPAIDLSDFANSELSFYQKNTYMASYYDYHGVYVSTVGGDPSTDMTWVELSEESTAYTAYTETLLDLSAYDGEERVHIAFVYHGDYATNWYIDDVLVEGDEANNAPSAVALLTPDDGDTVVVTPEMLAAGNDDIRFEWSGSTDDDGDAVSYILTLGVDDGTGMAVSLDMDSTLSGEYLDALYMRLMAAADSSTVDISGGLFTLIWDVSATDGMDTTDSDNGPFALTIDVGWFLGVDGHGLVPEQFTLHQNYPNPFNPITTIRYDVPEMSKVTIEVYNLLGMRIRTLVSGDHQAGYHAVRWNGLNDRGSAVASGMYIYRIQAAGATGTFTDIRKLVLMK